MILVTDNKESGLAFVQEIRKRLSALGCELHPKKFYCQHYTKGVEFIGTRIKLDRVYVSSRTNRNFASAISQYNNCIYLRKMEGFIASMNSYLGIYKNRNAYGIMRRILNGVSPKWSKFVHFNDARRCFQANEGFTHRELLSRKYNILFKNNKHYEHTRTTLCAGIATA